MTRPLLHHVYHHLLVLLVWVLIMGQFARIDLGSGRAFYFHDVFIMLILGIFLLERWSSRRPLALRGPLLMPLVAFASWVGLNILYFFAGEMRPFVTGWLYLARFLLILGFGYVLQDLTHRQIVSFATLRTLGLWVPTGIAIVGLAQYVFLPDTRSLWLLGWDDHYYRLISTIFDPGYTGILLVMGCILVLDYLARQRASQPSRVFWLSLMVCLAALLLTYSRASYLAFGVAMVLLGWLYRYLWPIVILLILLGSLPLLPRPGGEGVKLERTASIIARVESVDTAVGGLSGHEWVVGKGWYHLKERNVDSHSSAPENSLVFVLNSLGVVGLGLWLWLLLRLLHWASFQPGVVALIGALCVHGLFTNTLFYPFVLILGVWYIVLMAGSGPPALESSRHRPRWWL